MKYVVSTFLFVCAAVAVMAYENPVNYIDSVDPVQANIANDRHAWEITENELAIDTLNTEVSVLQTARDSICFYSNSSSQTIEPGNEAMEFNIDSRTDGIYAHPATTWYAVAVATAGYYEIFFAATVDCGNATGSNWGLVLQKYTAGWTTPDACEAFSVTSAAAGKFDDISRTVILELAADDSLRVLVYNYDGADNMSVYHDTQILYVSKLH